MAAIITNDVLDIGRRRNRGGIMGPEMTMGNPGQFDLPNVADVSTPESTTDSLCNVFPCLTLKYYDSLFFLL
jgi:hypothetical protein